MPTFLMPHSQVLHYSDNISWLKNWGGKSSPHCLHPCIHRQKCVIHIADCQFQISSLFLHVRTCTTYKEVKLHNHCQHGELLHGSFLPLPSSSPPSITSLLTHLVTPKSMPRVAMYFGTNLFSQ